MTPETLWTQPLYREVVFTIMAFLLALGTLLFFLRKRPHFAAGWASIKSWFFIAPFLFIVLALPSPWPLVFLVVVGIFSAKTFFQMVGMYHRNWFVWTTYTFMIALGYLAFHQETRLYNIMPMLFLAAISLIPLLRNSATHMIQYMALALMAFIFWGWSLLHMGHLLMLEQGAFIVIYLYMLSEFSENVSLGASRLFGRIKPFSNITSRVTIEGVLASVVLTVTLAWGMRHMLPDRSEQFWIAAGLSAALFGRLGDLTLSVIRRDLGIKNTGVFIIGRGDILSRVDKLMFVGPIYYYVYLFLQQTRISF